MSSMDVISKDGYILIIVWLLTGAAERLAADDIDCHFCQEHGFMILFLHNVATLFLYKYKHWWLSKFALSIR